MIRRTVDDEAVTSPASPAQPRAAWGRGRHGERSSLLTIGLLLLGFGAVSLLTSPFFGRIGEPLLEAEVLYLGSNQAGPFVLTEEHAIVNIDLHGGLVADNTWATLRCEILDAEGETLFGFRDVIWHEEGWDDEGSWVEWDVGVDLDAALGEGSYSLALFIEEAPGTAPRKGRYEEGDIRVQVAPVGGSHVPHSMAGTLAVLAGLLASIGSRFQSGTRRRWLEWLASVALVGTYIGLFFLAVAGYGYAGYGGADHGPSWWDWGAVPTEHGPGAARGRYPAHRDTLQREDGSLYAGETRDGEAHGTGRLIEASGTRTFGRFADGRPNGKVMIDYAQDSEWATYEGTMRDGQFDGEGTLWLRNGDQYVGSFARGSKHGTGTYRSADGRTRSGRWHDDEYLGP